MKSNEEIILENQKEIDIYKNMINLTKTIIELTENKDKWGNKSPLSDFTEELTNHIETYETSIKNRLFIIWGLKQ
jgi:hypothetical protein